MAILVFTGSFQKSQLPEQPKAERKNLLAAFKVDVAVLLYISLLILVLLALPALKFKLNLWSYGVFPFSVLCKNVRQQRSEEEQEVAESPWRFPVLSEFRGVRLWVAENLKIIIILLVSSRVHILFPIESLTWVAPLKKVAGRYDGSCFWDQRTALISPVLVARNNL